MMPKLDVLTIFVNILVLQTVMFIVILGMRPFQARTRKVHAIWVRAYILSLVGIGLMVLRPLLPEIPAIILGNSLAMAAVADFWYGTQCLRQRTWSTVLPHASLIIFVLIFTILVGDLSARTILFYTFASVLLVLMFLELRDQVKRYRHDYPFQVFLVTLMAALFMLFRAVMEAINPSQGDLWEMSPISSWALFLAAIVAPVVGLAFIRLIRYHDGDIIANSMRVNAVIHRLSSRVTASRTTGEAHITPEMETIEALTLASSTEDQLRDLSMVIRDMVQQVEQDVQELHIQCELPEHAEASVGRGLRRLIQLSLMRVYQRANQKHELFLSLTKEPGELVLMIEGLGGDYSNAERRLFKQLTGMSDLPESLDEDADLLSISLLSSLLGLSLDIDNGDRGNRLQITFRI